jgi:hypothetical protein
MLPRVPEAEEDSEKDAISMGGRDRGYGVYHKSKKNNKF